MSDGTRSATIPPRDPQGHKGTFGTVCVVGGCAQPPRVMIGGPAFAARAALRGGAGLAVLAVPAPILAAAITIAPGATGIALPVDAAGAIEPSGAAAALDAHLTGRLCLAVGPGLGLGDAARRLVLRLVAREDHPIILDADALNVLAGTDGLQQDLRAPAILTPHPGEYRRLAARLGIALDPTDGRQRPDAAAELARRLGAVVVLKGPGTVVTDGHRLHVNETGNAALGTAGTGDVLTGLCAALVAQFLDRGLDLLDCARLAVRLHGRAADRWVARTAASAGLLAEELADEIPGAIEEARNGDG